MRCLLKHIYTLIDISNKYHRSRCSLFFTSTGKGSRCHVVFHDLYTIFILKSNTGNLIKGDNIPHANQPNCFTCHVIKQVCNRCLTSRYKDTVWRNFFVYMRLASTSRSQLTEIKVIFHQWNHSGKKQPFDTLIKFIRLHACRAKKDIYPFIFGKCLSSILQILHINMRHLDWRQFTNTDWRCIFFIFLNKFIIQLQDTPNTATKEAVIF